MNLSFTKTDYFRERIHPVLTKIPFYAYSLLKRKSYLKDTGWFRSFIYGKSVDSQGNPIPWFTYGAIELLKARLPKDAVVFEYGCGLGTKWWANHALKVDAVEHRKEWYEIISKDLPDNALLQLKALNGDYSKAVFNSGRQYDVIVIDGTHRMECAKMAIQCLSNRGIIIYDDTDRPKSIEAIPFLKSKGFKHLSFVGFSPIEFMKCETTIFYKEGNLLDI